MYRNMKIENNLCSFERSEIERFVVSKKTQTHLISKGFCRPVDVNSAIHGPVAESLATEASGFTPKSA